MPPEISLKVGLWMSVAAQVSIGSRPQVLEDGNDVCNSESDSDNDDHWTEIRDGYKGIPTNSHGDPTTSFHRMTTEQANALRAVSQPANSLVSVSSFEGPQETPISEPVQEKKAGAVPKKKSQENEGSHMTTRSQGKSASEAGSLRSGVGSGSTDT
jgi:hypothetical protein